MRVSTTGHGGCLSTPRFRVPGDVAGVVAGTPRGEVPPAAHASVVVTAVTTGPGLADADLGVLTLLGGWTLTGHSWHPRIGA